MIAGLQRIAVALVAIAVLGLGGYYGWVWYDRSRDVQTTNDAYVRGEITAVSPRVSGYATEVLFDDDMPALGTVQRLKDAAERQDLATNHRHHASGRVTRGGRFTRGHLYCLLSNPLYVGDVAHKGATYPGRHDAIVDRQTFEAVQQQLIANATSRRSATNAQAPSLLTGLVYDETGDRLCPTHANKSGRRYRYYIFN